jgi:hypothetical protein
MWEDGMGRAERDGLRPGDSLIGFATNVDYVPELTFEARRALSHEGFEGMPGTTQAVFISLVY